MSPHRILPIELVEQVIDNLHNDAHSLSSCALVCRDWLHRSHFHRFASISLPISYDLVSFRCIKFRNLTAGNPKLILYVRSLTLHGVSILGSPVLWSKVQAIPLWSPPQLVTLRDLLLSQFEVSSLTELLPMICALPVLEHLSLDRIRVHPRSPVSHPDDTKTFRQARVRPLKSLCFTGEPIGESILEAESAEFAHALVDAGALRSGYLRNLTLLSGARGCAGWVPALPSLAASLQDCALSLHEHLIDGALTESARERILHAYDALRSCRELRSLCVQYNVTSTLMQCVFEGATRAIPGTSPFFLDALCDILSRPEETSFRTLEELSLVFVGSRRGLSSCAGALHRLAIVLMDRGKYPSFCKIKVRVDEPRYVTGLFHTGESSNDTQGSGIQDLLRGFNEDRIEVETKIMLVEP